MYVVTLQSQLQQGARHSCEVVVGHSLGAANAGAECLAVAQELVKIDSDDAEGQDDRYAYDWPLVGEVLVVGALDGGVDHYA